MTGDSVKVLCSGDLHLGRRSSRLPDDFSGNGYSCAATWDALVDLAISEQVDVVALSGDLVDRDNRYFEAIGPLERGLRRLSDANIDSFAVTGNHDFDVLPQIVNTLELDRFHLLGRNGQWERYTVRRDGQPILHIDGWSFPRQEVRASALHDYELSADGVPVLGIVHADLNQSASHYGPVMLSDLQRFPLALWLLGHIHVPSIIEEESTPVVIYPGSPQAMDPGEPGVHGVVIATIDPSSQTETRQVPLTSICYLPLTVDVSGLSEEEEVRSRIYVVLREALASNDHRYDRLSCLSCRLTLVGRTPLHGAMKEIVSAATEDLNLTGPSGAEAVIEKINLETQPAIDLEAIAKRNDPPGEVARIIQSLEGGEVAVRYPELVAQSVQQIRSVHESNPFSGIVLDDPLTEAEAEHLLLAESWSLLDTLIRQKETV